MINKNNYSSSKLTSQQPRMISHGSKMVESLRSNSTSMMSSSWNTMRMRKKAKLTTTIAALMSSLFLLNKVSILKQLCPPTLCVTMVAIRGPYSLSRADRRLPIADSSQILDIISPSIHRSLTVIQIGLKQMRCSGYAF